MEGAGNGFAGQNDVRERVRRDAAERGATHVVFVAAHDEEDRTPAQYHTRCRKGSCSTTTSGDYRFSRPHAGYLLVKVPRRNPAQLPLALGGRGASPGVRQPSRALSSSSPPVGSTTIERPRQKHAPQTASDAMAPSQNQAFQQARRNCYEQAKCPPARVRMNTGGLFLDGPPRHAVEKVGLGWVLAEPRNECRLPLGPCRSRANHARRRPQSGLRRPGCRAFGQRHPAPRRGASSVDRASSRHTAVQELAPDAERCPSGQVLERHAEQEIGLTSIEQKCATRFRRRLLALRLFASGAQEFR